VCAHESILYVLLPPEKDKFQRAELFEFEDLEAMVFSNLPNLLGKYTLRYDLRYAVEEVGDDPIEHLDQEGELL